MVLAVRLILPLAGMLAACSAAADTTSGAGGNATAATRPTDALDRVILGRSELVLVPADGGCALKVEGKVHPLGLPAPCGFLHRNRSPRATVEDYGDRGRVVMVIGPPAPAADYSAGMAETAKDRCASIGRPVLERGGRVALGEVMRSPAGYCPDIGMDEKFYYGIAHAKPFAARPLLR